MVLALPVAACFLVILVDLSNMWQARIELKDALDAASLSAMKTWGEGGSTGQARLDANDAFSANEILGNTFTLDTAQGGCTNGNVSSTSEIVLGTVTTGGTGFDFNCNATPLCNPIDPDGPGPLPPPPVRHFSICVTKTLQVQSISSTLFNFGPYDVTATSYARYTCSNGPPQLIHVSSVTCTCP